MSHECQCWILEDPCLLKIQDFSVLHRFYLLREGVPSDFIDRIEYEETRVLDGSSMMFHVIPL